MIPSKYDRIAGSIFGLAIGDALGFPSEFLSKNQIIKTYGHNGITTFESAYGKFPKGTYTDDTQMSIAIANGILISNTRHYSLENVMKNIKAEFIAWLHDPQNNRAPGDTCIQGCMNLEKGLHWSKSGVNRSKGCGAAMRTAPIGLFYSDLSTLSEVAYASSLATHGNPTGILSGMATAYLTHAALNGHSSSDFISLLINYSQDQAQHFCLDASEFIGKINQLREVVTFQSDIAIPILGEGWIGEEAIALSLYCFLNSPNEFRKSVLMAVNTNGDSDSIASITGAISGAYNGLRSIPLEWIEGIENRHGLERIAFGLSNSSSLD